MSKNKKNRELAKNDPDSYVLKNPDVIVGGPVTEGRDAKTGEIIKLDEQPRDYQAEIEKIPEEQRVQQIELYNTATGKKEIVTIDRRGMFDEKLGLILSDKSKTMDEKMSATSLWLFERGRESGAFIIDLLQSKGQFFKGAQQFKSEIRFDFTVFMETFCEYLTSNAQTTLNYLMDGKNAELLEIEAYDYLKKHPKSSIAGFIQNMRPDGFDTMVALQIDRAIRDQSEARLIRTRIKEIAEEREAAKGKGVYLDASGKATDNPNNLKPRME
ncbi:MAG: hypothetical protein ACYDBV_12780 [Nitrospiria bacterium]